MKSKVLINKIKHLNSKKIAAVVFLIMVFYVGSATFPPAVKSIARFLGGEPHDILAMANEIDSEYRGMLGFADYNLRNKGFYINLNGLMARTMGQRYMNERVKLDNGHLTHIRGTRNITFAATQLTRLYDKQLEKGNSFLFVLAPYQIPKYENILPAGYKDYGNQNADDLLNALKENGVPVLDLREEMRSDGIDHDDAFFITDHHWKPETGFWAYTKIIESLLSVGAIEPIDPFYTEIEKFYIETFQDFFLGAHGKRTGSYYAGVDDFSVITPTFDTELSIKIASRDIDIRGEFSETALNKERIQKDYFTANPHAAYRHGNIGFTQFRNDIAPVDLKVLTLGDSFSNVPYAFLPLVFSACDQMDMRHYEGDFAEYYSEYDPDIVIVLVNPNHIALANTAYDFFGDSPEKQEALNDSEDE